MFSFHLEDSQFEMSITEIPKHKYRKSPHFPISWIERKVYMKLMT
jgi:hypothetical protein